MGPDGAFITGSDFLMDGSPRNKRPFASPSAMSALVRAGRSFRLAALTAKQLDRLVGRSVNDVKVNAPMLLEMQR